MPDETTPQNAHREFATKIIAAYVRRNQIATDQIPMLISTVHRALADLGKPIAEAGSERTPAVPIRRSVHRDYVICLDCGWKGQMLRRHITAAHGLSVEDYRSQWSLPRDHAMTALAYSKRRSGLAKELGLGRRGAPSPAAGTDLPAAETPAAAEPTPRGRGRPRTPKS
jgi:predicted transcriptional regulator